MPDTRLKGFLEGLGSLSQFIDSAVVDVNTRGFGGDTRLKVAVVRQDLEAVTVLLAAGADPSIPGEDDYTPLHHAVGRESDEIVRLLLGHGALTSPRNIYGKTPLDYAKDTPFFVLLKDKTEASQPL